ncbi:MAG: cysteine--tRNA ligase, partial [Candidatus Paceibacterota bacterium]
GKDILTLEQLPAEVAVLVRERETARSEKNFTRADELREKISAAGFEIHDTDTGPELSPSDHQ